MTQTTTIKIIYGILRFCKYLCLDVKHSSISNLIADSLIDEKMANMDRRIDELSESNTSIPEIIKKMVCENSERGMLYKVLQLPTVFFMSCSCVYFPLNQSGHLFLS